MSTRTGPLSGRRILRLPQIVGSLVVVLGVFTLIFGAWTATSIWSFPRFVVAVVVLIYLSGKFVLDTAVLRLKPLEDLTLSLVLGMTVSSLLYWIAVYVGLPYLFALWPLLALTAYFYRRRKQWGDILGSRIPVNLSHVLLLGVIVLALIPLAALHMYYRNLDLQPQGGMTFFLKRDAIFHLSMANELTHSIPPQAPFLAGQPLGYHHGMDLLVAMLSKSAGLSVLDLTVRFVPTLLVIIAVLAVFCFSRIWLHSNYAAVLAAFLVILGEDFSFIPGLLLGSRRVWSIQFFGVPTVHSLYHMNPMLPALGILFSGLFCLMRFCRTGRRAWSIQAAFLFAVLMEYKIFATGHVLVSLAIAGFIYLLLFRDARLVKVLALTALMAVPLAVHNWLGTEAVAAVWFRMDPWPYIPHALQELGLLDTSLASSVSALFAKGPVTFEGLAALFLVALPAYLVGSLGLRVMAIPGLLKGLLFPDPSTVFRFFLALFVILGAPITLTWTVTPADYPHDYNNAVWFYVQSKYVAWVFVTGLVLTLCRGNRRGWQVFIVATVVALTVPSTVWYFQGRARPRLITIESNELEAVNYLKGACSDGRVVLADQELATYLVALTPCRVPLLDVLASINHSFASPSELAQRRADQDDFRRVWNSGEVRTDILESYEVGYVVLNKRDDATLATQEYSWISQKGAGEGVQGFMRPCFENEDYIIYEVLYEVSP